MQSHALFSTLKSRINDYNIILKKCQDAILVLKNNIEKIDTVLERANQNTSENQDTKSFKSLLLRQRIEEVNKKNKLEKMLTEQPADTFISLSHFQYANSPINRPI
jgi:hypothetical protein